MATMIFGKSAPWEFLHRITPSLLRTSLPTMRESSARQIIIDDRSSQAQREALEKILTGQDTENMATICWVINEMTTIHHETLFKRVLVEADIDLRKGRVNVEDVFH